MLEILNQYVQMLWGFFQFDVGVLSNKWMYIPLMIPSVAYVVFFFIKWTVLTAPIWMPIHYILRGVAGVVQMVVSPLNMKKG